MKRGYQQLLDEANAEITTLSPAEAMAAGDDPATLYIDLRDPREIEREGRIPGSLSCPRGMLEFWIDPDSPYHKPAFAAPHRFVFYCAAGWRSALATKTAQDMGLENTAHIDGGFAAWRDAGGPTEAGSASDPSA